MIWDFSTMKQQPLEFFFKFRRKSVLLLKFCQKREILNPQFCWYFLNVFLWIILMEMKVSQAGYFQITGCWIRFSILLNISFIVIFTTLSSKGSLRFIILFELKFQKSISRCSILQKISMSNFVIIKWRPFEYKVKSWKIWPSWGLFFRNKKYWHFEFFMKKIFG